MTLVSRVVREAFVSACLFRHQLEVTELRPTFT